VVRTPAFQAGGHGFDPRRPYFSPEAIADACVVCECGQVVTGRHLVVGAALLAWIPATAHAAGPVPRLGSTAVLQPVSGTVLVENAKTGRRSQLRGARAVPMGTAVDVAKGTVRVVTAGRRRGHTQRGIFRSGAFRLAQARNSTTSLRLVDSFKDACPATSAGLSAARRPRNRLFGRAHGRFRSVGRNSSATIRGTTWITEDMCSGSTVITAVAGGKVDAKSDGTSQLLEPGESSEDYCHDAAVPGVADWYCVGVLRAPKDNIFAFSLVIIKPGEFGRQPEAPRPNGADVCIRMPTGDEPCTTYPFNDYDIASDACSPAAGPGIYRIRWRVNGIDLPVPVTFTSTRAHEAYAGCLYRPAIPGGTVSHPDLQGYRVAYPW
jgi:hypothetical protein